MAELSTINKQIGTCPGCRFAIWAKVDVSAELERPRYDNDKLAVNVRVKIAGVQIDHKCNGTMPIGETE